MPQRNDRSRSTSTTSPKNNSWFRMQAGHQSDADIYIYDEIGFWGVTAKQFISDLNALGDITHINLHINSPGGDVFEGIAIFNALKTHGASITVYVDGVAASMASVIAMVGNPVIMPENTFMMIHKPFGFTGGDAEDMRTYADLLDKVEAVLLPAYAQKTGKTTDEIAAMLADETWMAASINIKPGHDYYFYIRSVNTVGKSAFVEAVGRASDDAEGYLDFFKGKITESHLGKELLEKVELTEDNASRLEEFSKEWKDANDKWNAMWAVKIEQTKDGKHYVAGIGLSMEDTEEGKLSQFLVAANRIAFIDPANGNETPMFVAQGNQIFMNDVFLKRLTAPTITSGGNPPAFSLTPDGKLTAKNADISGSVNANSGTLSNVTIAENCTINGTLRAEKIVGDIVKAASAAFPRQRESSVDWPSGTRTVTVTDDHPFDRQIVVLPLTFRGSKRTVSGRTTYSMCYLKVLMNGAVIYDGAANEAVQVFSRIVDMPAGRGNVILTFTLTSTRHSADIPPDTFASDVQVMVIKKQALGISVV
ncbi:head maturation protease, ClpP-related [Escherichia coli]